MYDLINSISTRCHKAAVKRGKATGYACIGAAADEIKEYWAAMDAAKQTDEENIRAAEAARNDIIFELIYSERLHNTVFDELADVLIVAATWTASAKESDASFNTERNLDAILAGGLVTFVANQVHNTAEARALRRMINLKMRYNELRKD